MLKFINAQVVFQEFPGETTLAINISGCPNHCPDCHSKYLWKDTGYMLTKEKIDEFIKNNPMITCVGFMGGDQSIKDIKSLRDYIKQHYRNIKVGWYSGRNMWSDEIMQGFDYVKFGPYKKECGGLDSPTTNQVMYKYIKIVDKWLDITKYFQTKDPTYHEYINMFESYLLLMSKIQHESSYGFPRVTTDGKKEYPEFTSYETMFEVHKIVIDKYFEENCRESIS